jgi:type VI secretion system protein ImpG
MDDKFLTYYERELTFIRELGAEFAKKYPKIAGRLLLEPDRCEDPHTERLIEAFAFLCGRVHKKIDDDFPEITESLLNILYPHYITPIPSMSVVRFEPVKKNLTAAGYRIEKNTPLYSRPVGGSPCQFVTSYPVSLWPIEVVSAGLRDPKKLVKNAQQTIFIQLKTYNNLTFSEINWERVRFFLNGQGHHVFHLYELLFNHICHVEFESISSEGKIEVLPLSPDNIHPVGFGPDEGMIPYPQRSFPGYLLLFEYFCFPEKFLFFDLAGLDKLKYCNVSDSLEIRIYVDRVAKPNLLVNEETFCLHATPVVNLFKRIAEPILVEQEKTEYRVIPDIRRLEATEVFSIDRVISSSATATGKEMEFRPFYSISHSLGEENGDPHRPFWNIERRPSGKKGDEGTEVFLSFTDWNFKPEDPGVETVTVYATCTNRDLPARLPFGDPMGDFSMELVAPVARISCLIKPTPTRRPSLGGALQWRLLSHLAINYLSLTEGGGEALKEILKLYDFDDSAVTRQQISGITSLESRYVTKRIGQSICRGIEVTLQFDEDRFVGTGLYLFASVLEVFLGQYVSVNSFSQMIAKTVQRKEVLKKWAPRNGNRVLL